MKELPPVIYILVAYHGSAILYTLYIYYIASTYLGIGDVEFESHLVESLFVLDLLFKIKVYKTM